MFPRYMASISIVVSVLLIGMQSSPLGSWFLIAGESENQILYQIAYNSLRQEYLVVWQDELLESAIWAQRVSNTGALIGAPIVITYANWGVIPRTPAVAYNSQHDEYLVVWWERDTNTGTNSIRGRRVSATGWLPGDKFTVVSGPSDDVYYTSPGVAYASISDRYLVIYKYGNVVGWLQHGIAARAYSYDTSPDGDAFDVRPYGLGQDICGPRLTYNRSRNEFLIVWTEWTAGALNVWGQRVKMTGGAGTIGSLFKISLDTDTSGKYWVDVASLPFPAETGQYLVVWDSYILAGDGNISGRIIAGDGTFPESSMIAIAADPVDQNYPAVSGSESGRHYLVTWRQASDPPLLFIGIRGRAISSQGTLLWQESGIGGISAGYAGVAAGPHGDFLIAYSDQPYTDDINIYGRLWGNRNFIPLMIRYH